MRRFFSVFAALATLALPPATAGDPLEPPDPGLYLRWGPLRVRPNVSLTNFGYDDNIFYRTAGQADPVGDYTATISPRVEGLVLFGHRAFVTFREQLDGVFYAKTSEINYLNQRGDMRVTLPMGRMGFLADLAVNRTHDRPTSETDDRPQRNELRAGAGFLLHLGWRTDLELAHTRSDWSYEDPDFPCAGVGCVPYGDRLDRMERGNDLRIRYRAFGRTTFSLEAAARSIEFDRSVERDAREDRIVPGIEFGEGGALTGTLRAGRGRIDSLTPGLADFSGWMGNAELALQVDARTTFTLTGRRAAAFAVFSRHQFAVHTSAEARVVRYLTRSFGLEAAALRGRLAFSEDVPEDPRRDRIVQLEGGVRLRLAENTLGRRLEYTFRVRRIQRDSSPDDRLDQSRTSAGFGVVVGY